MIEKEGTLLNLASLSTSSVSRFAKGIFSMARSAIGKQLDEHDILHESAQATYFSRL